MKKTSFLKALAFCLVMTSTLFAEAPPLVHFDISVQKALLASNIVLHYSIQKKASNIESATQALELAIQKIKVTAQGNTVSSADVKLQNSFASPSEWLFGKDYIVNATATITVRDMSKYPALAKLLTQLDPDIKFDSISFDYSKQDSLWQPLIEEAVQDAKTRKDVYEKLFGIKLRLNFMREARYAPDNGGYVPRMMMLKQGNESVAADANTDLLPSQVYRLNLQVSYIIAPPEPKKPSQLENLLKKTSILH